MARRIYEKYGKEEHEDFLRRCANRWTDEQKAQIYEDRKSGMTFEEMGIKWDRTGSRMSQIIKKLERNLQRTGKL